MKVNCSDDSSPVQGGERYPILDVLRGLALFGICLANFPEFSLYSFLPQEAVAAMPTAGADRVVRALQYVLVDGKFYTMFSILFGIGFSIMMANAERRHADGFRIFYRRMAVLLAMGFLHLMFLWSGDILMLYAALGLLLPWCRRVSNRGLLSAAAVLLLLPVVLDAAKEVSGFEPSAPVIRAQQYFCDKFGITEENFAVWLRDAGGYGDVFRFLVQGAFVRMQELIDGNRFFKVMGLFLLGFWIGRNRLYADLERCRPLLRKVAMFGFSAGLPVSVLYAWSSLNGHPWGLAGHSALYAFGVFPLGLAYMAAVCLWYVRRRECAVFRLLAAPGRMALSNYIGQSVLGMAVFYGIGFGFGAGMGLSQVMAVAAGVFLFEMAFSVFWLRFFRFGPLEWVWRMLTYGKRLPLLKGE